MGKVFIRESGDSQSNLRGATLYSRSSGFIVVGRIFAFTNKLSDTCLHFQGVGNSRNSMSVNHGIHYYDF